MHQDKTDGNNTTSMDSAKKVHNLKNLVKSLKLGGVSFLRWKWGCQGRNDNAQPPFTSRPLSHTPAAEAIGRDIGEHASENAAKDDKFMYKFTTPCTSIPIKKMEIIWKDAAPGKILSSQGKLQNLSIHLKLVKVPKRTTSLGLKDNQSNPFMLCDAPCPGNGTEVYIKRYLQEGGYQSSVSLLIDRDWVIPSQLIKNPADRTSYGEMIPQWKLNAAEIATIRQDMLFRDSGETFGHICSLFDSLMSLNCLRKWNAKIQKLQNYRLPNSSLLEVQTLDLLPKSHYLMSVGEKMATTLTQVSSTAFGMSGSATPNSHIATPSERTRRHPSR